MLGLYLYTLIIGHKSCNMLSTCLLNKLTLQKELQYFVTNNVFLDKSKITSTKKKIKHKNPCWIWEWNLGPLVPKADALPLHH